MQRIVLVALDHPYASIVINLMEGRLPAATSELDIDPLAVEGDVEAFAGLPPPTGPPSSPDRKDTGQADWRYHQYGNADMHGEAVGAASSSYSRSPSPSDTAIPSLEEHRAAGAKEVQPDVTASLSHSGSPRLADEREGQRIVWGSGLQVASAPGLGGPGVPRMPLLL